MMSGRKGVLLINLGTPDSPAVYDVRKYLREFLMDARVIDIPWLKRCALVHFIIAPFRASSSAAAYQKLWGIEGSPLKYYGLELERRLQQGLDDSYIVKLAMRYQSPSITSVLEDLRRKNLDELIVIPLYPQYASASTGSSIECLFKGLQRWEVLPKLCIIPYFFDQPFFIETFARLGGSHLKKQKYDHVLFSYHGLPQRQIHKASREGYCRINDKCCSVYHSQNRYCYRAQCFETSRLLAKRLGLQKNQYTVCFQSRLGKDPWVKPYTDEVLTELVKSGKKNVLCFSPSFVADCLETTVEIGMEYKHSFLQAGGERLDLVESLNVDDQWVEGLKGLITASCKDFSSAHPA